MKPHCDHIHSLFDGEQKGIPMLSVVASLNDDYEGGDFIMWEDQKLELPAGSIIVFPSNFMFPHSVNTVTSGIRYSFVSWVW
jgi:predicted 2-oxoglutarate/Fe(II)-dependent dioxygenase YbiX